MSIVDFDFDRCGIEKRCQRARTIEGEKHENQISKKNKEETNDPIERGELP